MLGPISHDKKGFSKATSHPSHWLLVLVGETQKNDQAGNIEEPEPSPSRVIAFAPGVGPASLYKGDESDEKEKHTSSFSPENTPNDIGKDSKPNSNVCISFVFS